MKEISISTVTLLGKCDRLLTSGTRLVQEEVRHHFLKARFITNSLLGLDVYFKSVSYCYFSVWFGEDG